MPLLLALLAPAFAAEGHAAVTPKGFEIADDAGDSLVLNLRFEPRYIIQFAPDAADEDALSGSGFRVRRALLRANGTLATDYSYRFRINAASALDFTDGDGKAQQVQRPILDDAQLGWIRFPAAKLFVGQFKTPVGANWLVGVDGLAFPERGPLTEGLRAGDVKLDPLTFGRDIGATVEGAVAEGRLDYTAGVFDGDGQNRWPADPGMLWLARVQVSPLGPLAYDELDLSRGAPRLALAAWGGLNSDTTFTGDLDGHDRDLRAGAELRFAAAGAFVSLEAMGRWTPTDLTRQGGAALTASWLSPVGLAPAARLVVLDPDRDAAGDALTTVDAGLNWLLPTGPKPSHKVQLDANYELALQGDSPLYHQATVAASLSL